MFYLASIPCVRQRLDVMLVAASTFMSWRQNQVQEWLLGFMFEDERRASSRE